MKRFAGSKLDLRGVAAGVFLLGSFSGAFPRGDGEQAGPAERAVAALLDALPLPRPGEGFVVEARSRIERPEVDPGDIAAARQHYLAARERCPGEAIEGAGERVRFVSPEAVGVVHALDVPRGGSRQGYEERIAVSWPRFAVTSSRHSGAPGVESVTFHDARGLVDVSVEQGRHGIYGRHPSSGPEEALPPGGLRLVYRILQRVPVLLEIALEQGGVESHGDSLHAIADLSDPHVLGRFAGDFIGLGFKDAPGYAELTYDDPGGEHVLTLSLRDCLDALVVRQRVRWLPGESFPRLVQESSLLPGTEAYFKRSTVRATPQTGEDLERLLSPALEPGAAVDDYRFPIPRRYVVRADGSFPTDLELLVLAEDLDGPFDLSGSPGDGPSLAGGTPDPPLGASPLAAHFLEAGREVPVGRQAKGRLRLTNSSEQHVLLEVPRVSCEVLSLRPASELIAPGDSITVETLLDVSVAGRNEYSVSVPVLPLALGEPSSAAEDPGGTDRFETRFHLVGVPSPRARPAVQLVATDLQEPDRRSAIVELSLPPGVDPLSLRPRSVLQDGPLDVSLVSRAEGRARWSVREPGDGGWRGLRATPIRFEGLGPAVASCSTLLLWPDATGGWESFQTTLLVGQTPRQELALHASIELGEGRLRRVWPLTEPSDSGADSSPAAPFEWHIAGEGLETRLVVQLLPDVPRDVHRELWSLRLERAEGPLHVVVGVAPGQAPVAWSADSRGSGGR